MLTKDNIDDLPVKQPLNLVTNKHGETWTYFFDYTCYAIMIGRITPKRDSHSSISTKGLAVVYFIPTIYENGPNVIELLRKDFNPFPNPSICEAAMCLLL